MSRMAKIQQMLRADPNDVFLSFSLAMEYAKEGRSDEAVKQFARVTELDPNHVSAHFQWASVLVSLKRNDEALGVLERGIAVAKRVNDNHAADKMNEMRKLIE